MISIILFFVPIHNVYTWNTTGTHTHTICRKSTWSSLHFKKQGIALNDSCRHLQVGFMPFPCMGKLLRVKEWCSGPCTQCSWIVQVGLMGHEEKCKMIFNALSINHLVYLLLYPFCIWRCSGLEHMTLELLCGTVLKTTPLKRNGTCLPSDSLQESWHFKWLYS